MEDSGFPREKVQKETLFENGELFVSNFLAMLEDDGTPNHHRAAHQRFLQWLNQKAIRGACHRFAEMRLRKPNLYREVLPDKQFQATTLNGSRQTFRLFSDEQELDVLKESAPPAA